MNTLYARVTTEYCERIYGFFYSEPLNAFSNLAFFVSAYFIYKKLKKHQVNKAYWLLWSLMILIGIGSFLWHTIRSPYTLALDSIPIYLFILLFIYCLLQNLVSLKIKSIFIIIGFLIFQVTMSALFPDLLNGSVRHFFNAIFFITLITLIYKKYNYFSKDIVIGITAYISAIIFRSIDNSICSVFPIGTHFIWHTLNAVALYFALNMLIELDLYNLKKKLVF